MMKLSKLFMVALLVGTLGVLGCGDDETTSGTGGMTGTGGTGGSPDGGPNCTQELCMTNDTLMANCQREYDSCIATGELTQAECIVFAEETCTI